MKYHFANSKHCPVMQVCLIKSSYDNRQMSNFAKPFGQGEARHTQALGLLLVSPARNHLGALQGGTTPLEAVGEGFNSPRIPHARSGCSTTFAHNIYSTAVEHMSYMYTMSNMLYMYDMVPMPVVAKPVTDRRDWDRM